jgi:hypothetical protein
MTRMDPYSPINGISLEQYAELGADVADHVNDKEACARIVEAKGIRRADWDAAVAGWTARMQDMSLMGQVAMRYMPMYQAALARKKGTVDCSWEDFLTLSAAQKAWGADRMYSFYQLDATIWTQVAGPWMQRVPTDPRYQMYGMLVEQEAQRLSQGGQPRPVRLTSSQTGGAPVPVAQPQGQAPNAQQVENQMTADAVRAQVAATMAAAQAQSAAAYGNASANMGMMGRGVLGAVGYGAIAAGIGPGMAVLVQWSDGQKYPATVAQVGGGQVCVAFGDGRQMWVPETAVSRRQ